MFGSILNPMLILYLETLVEVSQAHTPKKSKTRSKGLVIQGPTGEAQPQKKRKVVGVLETFPCKKLATKPMKHTLKKMSIEKMMILL